MASDGSSPLSRGIPSRLSEQSELLRIIPALAGNTGSGVAASLRYRDHPRSRGEYVAGPTCWGQWLGSSPLSRGIRGRVSSVLERPGIIPALAGNTPIHNRPWSQYRDHPRSRGEYCLNFNRVDRTQGSSPLSRGILPNQIQIYCSPRIIPALAGNTPAVPAPNLRVERIIPALAGNT